MPSLHTKTKSVRLPNEISEWVESIPFREVMESLYRQVESGRIEIKGGEVVVKGEDVGDFKEMLNLCGMDFEEFFQRLYRKVEAGEIDIMDMV